MLRACACLFARGLKQAGHFFFKNLTSISINEARLIHKHLGEALSYFDHSGRETNKELNPCPFCGGEAVLINKMSGSWVKCKECPATVYLDGHFFDNSVVDCWNRRAK